MESEEDYNQITDERIKTLNNIHDTEKILNQFTDISNLLVC